MVDPKAETRRICLSCDESIEKKAFPCPSCGHQPDRKKERCECRTCLGPYADRVYGRGGSGTLGEFMESFVAPKSVTQQMAPTDGGRPWGPRWLHRLLRWLGLFR